MMGALSGRWLITQTLVCNSGINDMFDCCVSACPCVCTMDGVKKKQSEEQRGQVKIEAEQ